MKSDEKEFPTPEPTMLKKKSKRGTSQEVQLWKHRVEPLLAAARRVLPKQPDLAFRVYLAADLAFLADELASVGCEVYFMKSSSLRHSPGSIWRFLALEEKGCLVTVSESHRATDIEHDIARTQDMQRAGLGFWRSPVVYDLDPKGECPYKPISGSQFGAIGGFSVRPLFEALTWHTRRGSIETKAQLPGGCGASAISGTHWPDFGFDEWLLLAAIYPRAAIKGMLTLAPTLNTSRILPMDVEYATWANPRSELVYVGNASASCCPPKADARQIQRVPVREISYWNRAEKLPFLLNNLGLKGQAVKIGVRDSVSTGHMLRNWRGHTLHVVERWKPRPKHEWMDVENYQTAEKWHSARAAFDAVTKGSRKVRLIENTSAKARLSFSRQNLDLVWLNENKSYAGVLKNIEEWWPLLREGGVMGGFGCRDRFEGNPYKEHSWHATRTALKTWSKRTGRGFFVSNDGKDAWLMFKTKLPRPQEVLVISAASKEVTYAAVTTANHRAYCKRWGHPYHLFGDEDFDRSRRLCWSKIKMLRTALKRYRWVFWIDCDAIFNDWSVPITRLCISPFYTRAH